MSAIDDLLKGKTILIVDDEPDVLDTLGELLSMCNVVKAGTFEEAKRQLETRPFDVAVLDIMGVDGYKLLGIAAEKKVIAVMFTAYALGPEDVMISYRHGAAYFVPKDKMSEMPEILANILEARQKGGNTWVTFADWAEPYYRMKFGPGWQRARAELEEELETVKIHQTNCPGRI